MQARIRYPKRIGPPAGGAVVRLRDVSDRFSRRKTLRTRRALTHVRCLSRIELPTAVGRYATARYSLVECRPRSGRRHQIRRHLKHLRHPIIGDANYGDGAHNRFFRETLGIGGLLLAATRLRLRHPFSGVAMCYRHGIPPEVMHIVATHSHEGDKVQRSIESIIFHHADFVDFDIAKYLGAMAAKR